MSDNSVNLMLANWVHSRVCKQCREAGAGLASIISEHEDCNNHLAVISWLLGKRGGDGELRRLRHWVRARRGGNGQWRAIEEKMQREIARREAMPRIKCQEIGMDNIDYWGSWQEENE